MKIALCGARGRMGRAFERQIGDNEIVFGQSRTRFQTFYPVYNSLEDVSADFDVMIDFSYHENAKNTIKYCILHQKPLIMGTTALSKEDEALLAKLSEIAPVLYSHNTSVMFNKFLKILDFAASIMEEDNDIELIERHDKNKKDAPSGSSSLVLKALEKGAEKEFSRKNGRLGIAPKQAGEIGVHSVRGGSLGSEHYVSIFGVDEEIQLNHVAISYDVYASGALWAAKKLMKMPCGLYEMMDLID